MIHHKIMVRSSKTRSRPWVGCCNSYDRPSAFHVCRLGFDLRRAETFCTISASPATGLAGAGSQFTGADGSFSMNSYSERCTSGLYYTRPGHIRGSSTSAPPTTQFSAGAYESAQRGSVGGTPTARLLRGRSGCNDLTGRFDVLEIVRDASGAVTSCRQLEQHCNGIVPALLGQIRYNSDVPVIKTPKSRSRIH